MLTKWFTFAGGSGILIYKYDEKEERKTNVTK